MGTQRVRILAGLPAACMLFSALTIPVAGQEKKTPAREKSKRYAHVPNTVSAALREYLAKLPDPAQRPRFPAPDDFDGWKRFHQAREKDLEPRVESALQKYEPLVTERKVGGIPVLDIKPKGWKNSQKLLVY